MGSYGADHEQGGSAGLGAGWAEARQDWAEWSAAGSSTRQLARQDGSIKSAGMLAGSDRLAQMLAG